MKNQEKILNVLILLNVKILSNLNLINLANLKVRSNDIDARSKLIVKESNKLLKLIFKESKINQKLNEINTNLRIQFDEDIEKIKKSLREIISMSSNEFESKEIISNKIQEISTIIKKEIYIEKLLMQINMDIRKHWENNIHNKQDWLYHATSIILLGSIKKYGLNTNKLPKGIKRGIAYISMLFEKYGIERGKHDFPVFDTENIIQKGISLSFSKENIKEIAGASNFPVFLYELLYEEYLKQKHKRSNFFSDFIDKLKRNETKIFKAIMRFGNILRKKNKVVIIHVLICPKLLKLLKIPNFIDDFDAYLNIINTNELVNPWQLYDSKNIRLNVILRKYGNSNAILNNVGYTYGIPKIGDEIRLQKIPKSLLYIEISKNKIVQLSKWDEYTVPIIF